jgi:penicillin amidase
MKWIKLAALSLLLYTLIWALNTTFLVGTTRLPAFGELLNPFTGFWQNAEPKDAPVLPSSLRLDGLKEEVSVLYDELLVPHIFAQNLEDAFLVQGYITAQQRLFQMDITARKVAGELSEIMGERTVPIDLSSRRRGLAWAAERDLQAWEKTPETIQLLDAYTKGVNAWMDDMGEAGLPVECKLLGYRPSKWTNLKSVMVMEAMADNLANFDQDLEASNTKNALGASLFDDLFPTWNPKQAAIVPGPYKTPNKKQPLTTQPPIGLIQGIGEDGHPEINPTVNGSNNWALSGTKTASGKPILANDPHLALTLPSIWFQVHLHVREINTYGVALPGLPGVVIGFNDQIAWGFTNVGADVKDWYKIKWLNQERTIYSLDNKEVVADLRIEQVVVNGKKEPVIDTIRYTVWGPVPYNDPTHPLYGCALRWSPHDPDDYPALSRFLGLNKASNQQEYTEAITGFAAPAQNIIFADKNGDIAITVQGNLPIRQGEEGRFIQDGSTQAAQWRGYIPHQELPKMHNPERGFVTSANQHSTEPGYQYYFPNGSWDHFRGRTAVDWLDKMSGATTDSMKAMQCSNFNLRAAEALPLLLNLLDKKQLNQEQQALVAKLADWNAHYENEEIAPTLFEWWFDSTYTSTFDEVLELQQQKISMQLPPTWRFIELLAQAPHHDIFDQRATAIKEQAGAIVTKAFIGISEKARQLEGSQLKWGVQNALSVHHIARIAPFSVLNIPMGGNANALNAIKKEHGPSWRMIVEMGEEVKAFGVYPGGQSGNPGSPFYDNMLSHWMEGAYYELNFWKRIEDAPATKVIGKTVFKAN